MWSNFTSNKFIFRHFICIWASPIFISCCTKKGNLIIWCTVYIHVSVDPFMSCEKLLKGLIWYFHKHCNMDWSLNKSIIINIVQTLSKLCHNILVSHEDSKVSLTVSRMWRITNRTALRGGDLLICHTAISYTSIITDG